MRRTKIVHSIGNLIVLAPMLWFSGCGGDREPGEGPAGTVAVRTETVVVRPLEHHLTYSGTVEPIERVTLSTKVMGWVEAVYVDEGAPVHKGDELIKVRSKELEAKRAQAEAGIVEAEAHSQNLSTNLKRIEALHQKKAATQKELDDIRSAFAAAQARRSVAEEMKKEVDDLLKYTLLIAPFDGVVARKTVEAGDMAAPGNPLLIVEKLDQVKIVAKVPESEIENIKAGMAVRVGLPAAATDGSEETVEGSIDQVVPSTAPMSRQFRVKVLLDNSQRRFKPGMFARISVTEMGSPTMIVPRSAIFRRGQLEGVFVMDPESRARLRWVRTGGGFGEHVEILSGVTSGERVIVERPASLVDGAVVEVAE